MTLDTAKAWQLEGANRYRAGDLPGAIAALGAAARLDPTDAAYRLNLAELERAAGRPDAAREHLEAATALTDRDVGRLNLLSAAWLDHGAPDRALEAAIPAVEAGGDATSRQLFVQSVRLAPSPAARSTLAAALREGWGRIDLLGAPALAILRAAWPESLPALAADELLSAVLSSLPLRDEGLERQLTRTRRNLLLAGAADGALPLLAGIATQCHLNEYAWAVEPAEAQAVERLRARLGDGSATAAEVLLLACYVGLGGVDGAVGLSARDWPESVRAVLTQQVSEPAEEQALAGQMQTLTPIRAGVSEQVRAQYEENPYPSWTKPLLQPPAPLDAILRATLPGVTLDAVPAPDVLVAGCGSGQHAIHAARYAGARVLAVDLSRASLGYAARKAREAGITNVTFAQADLLDLPKVGRTFDVIESVGVLHHLADPVEGAKALASMLRPGGLMKLGLYSARARRILAPAKVLATHYPPTAQGIRELRAAIMGAPAGDPVRAALAIGDFFATSSCRDLLMHVQEHELGVDDLRRMLDESGLRLLGFTVAPAVLAAYRRRFPDDPTAVDLDHWGAFEAENPATFLGMYQFWAQKPA